MFLLLATLIQNCLNFSVDFECPDDTEAQEKRRERQLHQYPDFSLNFPLSISQEGLSKD